jgi:uncharacterized protein YuzE
MRNTFSVQVTYRKGRPFAAYIYLQRKPGQKSARTERVSSEVLIDYAADGTPLGIEIVSPGHVSIDEINEAFKRLGMELPEPRDLEPLKAA